MPERLGFPLCDEKVSSRTGFLRGAGNAIIPQVTSEFVFLSYQSKGMSTTAIHKRLMRYRKTAGIHMTAHQLRHSFANDLVSAEMPVTSIQKLLGHYWITTTQNYVAANDPQVKADFYAVTQRLEGWSDE